MSARQETRMNRSTLSWRTTGWACAALCVALGMAATAAAAAGTELSGFWKPSAVVSVLHTRGGGVPPLLPGAAAMYDSRVRAPGDRTFDDTLQCLPPGLPRILGESAFEIAQTPTQLLFLYEWNRLQRVVPVRADHVEFDRAYPYYLGHPAAHWEAGTLVVDSIDFNADTVLDASGLPHGEQLHVVERIALAGRDTLVDRVRIEDPQYYSRPWEAEYRFQRMPAGTLFAEDVCVLRLGLKGLNTRRNLRPTH